MIRLLIIFLLMTIVLFSILTLSGICEIKGLSEKTSKKKTNTFDEDLEKLAEKIKNK